MNDKPINTEFVLGQILEKVSNTDANVARLVWRADNIEGRVEALEKAESARKAESAKPKSMPDKVWEWVIRATAVGLVGFLLLQAGLGA